MLIHTTRRSDKKIHILALLTSSPGSSQIGINLADPIFRGVYHGKERHPDDLRAVISRAQEVGCQKLIVTGSDLTSSRHALDIAKEYRERDCFLHHIFPFIFFSFDI